jgi:hypothetical protein
VIFWKDPGLKVEENVTIGTVAGVLMQGEHQQVALPDEQDRLPT